MFESIWNRAFSFYNILCFVILYAILAYTGNINISRDALVSFILGYFGAGLVLSFFKEVM
jgi:hypothetical protein